MLLRVLFLITMSHFVISKELDLKESKPYVIFPIPLELPNRNDRADQCWLRIEDVELVETITVYCYMAKAFLRSYIQDNNYKRMDQDDVNVRMWNEELPSAEGIDYRTSVSNSKNIKDWRITTVLDPTVNKRIYVSKKADCKLVMYSREGMLNYKVDCDKILYFINSSTSAGVAISCIKIETMLIVMLIFYVSLTHI